jgi:hypothetical protein
MHTLDGARLKLRRAEEHIHAFGEESVPYLNSHFCHIDFKGDGDFRRYFLVVDEPPPLRLSAILEDAVHNIRSSLDHLAWQLVLVNGQQPTNRTVFPIFETDAAYQKQKTLIVKGMPPKALTLIDELQPYFGGRTPLNDPLWFLYQLDNADKHRTLNLTQGRLVPAVVSIITQKSRVEPVTVAGGVVHNGAEVASFRLADFRLDEYVKVDGEGTSLITLDDAGPWGQEPVVNLVVKALNYVGGQVFCRFEPFFGPTP